MKTYKFGLSDKVSALTPRMEYPASVNLNNDPANHKLNVQPGVLAFG